MLNTRFAYLYSFMYIYAKRVFCFDLVTRPRGSVFKKTHTIYTKHGENAFIFIYETEKETQS